MRRLLAVAAFVLCASPLSAAATDPPRPGEAQRIRGNEAYDQDRLDEAVTAWRESFALAPRYDLAANLAEVEGARGRDAEAARWLGEALRLYPPDGDAAQRTALEQRLAKLRSKVGAVRVRCDEAAVVGVDGQAIGVAPLDQELLLAPGRHRFSAKGNGREAVDELDVAAGATHAVALAVPDDTTRIALLGAGAGLAVVTGALGAGLLAGAADREAQASDGGDALTARGSDCVAEPAVCEEIARHQDARDELNVAGVTLVVIGGAAGIATVIAAVVTGGSSDESARLLEPIVVAAGDTLVPGVRLRF